MFKIYKNVIVFVLVFAVFMTVNVKAENKVNDIYNINVGFYDETYDSKCVTWQSNYYTKQTFYYKSGNDIVEVAPIGVKNVDFSTGKTYYTYSVKLENLTPNTLYYYNINDNTSFPYHFKTGKKDEDEFTFLTFSDTQALDNDYKKYIGYSFKNSFSGFDDIAFVSFLGDMVDKPTKTQWDSFFKAIKGTVENYTIVPLAGNHDYVRDGKYYYKANFTNGKNTGINKGFNSYFSFEYGSALFFVLNTDDDINAQIDFINETCKTSDKKWRIVLMHKSLYGGLHSSDSDVLKLKEELVPIFDENEIDLVLSGHDHIYQRSYFMENDEIKYNEQTDEIYESPNGVLYITSGATGPKKYDFYKNDWVYKYWLPDKADINKPNKKLFNAISVSNDKLKVDVYTSDFEKVDSVTIIK